ncbi:MAG: undecaprenyl-phosphate glucose phosphotransferase [Steroidobacteraceae bacterium]
MKSLLFPVIPVLTLLVCLLFNHSSLKGPYFLVAVLAFLGAADFLESAQFRGGASWRRARHMLLTISIRWVLLIGFIATLLYLADLAGHFDYEVLGTWAMVTPLALWAGQIGTHQFLIRRGLSRKSRRKAVIVGLTEQGVRLEKSLQADPLLRIEIAGYFEDRSAGRLTLAGAAPVLGTSAKLAEYVVQNDISIVYITLPMSRNRRILGMLESLRDSTASIYFVPDLLVYDLIQARFDILNGVPVVAVCETPFFGMLPLVKRLSDMIFASLVLLLASPLFLLMAIAIRLQSPGPILFKQKRYGLDGREIMVYKFRSMTVTEDGQSKYTQVVRDDSRVTRLGAFLRRTSLDELPQFINVLQGSMSVVGPRPHAIAVNERYRQLIPSYMSRHKVKPGITGWAQVNGYRGGDDIESMTKRVQYDLDYLRYWSLWLDFVIVLKTAALVWSDRRAY